MLLFFILQIELLQFLMVMLILAKIIDYNFLFNAYLTDLNAAFFFAVGAVVHILSLFEGAGADLLSF